MKADDFAKRVMGVAVLAEPVRRELYLYIAAQREPVGRDQAAEGVGVARHTAKFHLDKLVAEGLLETEFKRLSGRAGPGAGRPAKLYKRSDRQVSVTLPERRYDRAGQLMAKAIDESAHEGTDVVVALHGAAADLGAQLGQSARVEAGARPSSTRLVAAACAALAREGYEPRRDGDTITLVNCPFDALARDHTALVCGMNLALLDAAVDGLGETSLTARLDPGPERCCVVLTAGRA